MNHSLPAHGRATWLPPAEARVARLAAMGWGNSEIASRTGLPALRVNALVQGLRERLRLPESASRAMLVHQLLAQRHIPVPARDARPALIPTEARLVRAWGEHATRLAVAEALAMRPGDIDLWTQTLLRKIHARNIAHLVALGHALGAFASTHLDANAPLPVRPGLLPPARAAALGLLARGMGKEEIAMRLHVSPHTVTSHLKAARAALGCPPGTAHHVLVHTLFATGAATPPSIAAPPPLLTAAQLHLWIAVATHSLSSDIARAVGTTPHAVRPAIGRLTAHAGTDSALGLVIRGHAWNWWDWKETTA